MQIEIGVTERHSLRLLLGVVMILLLGGFALVGRFVTPSVSGEIVLLTPERWQAIALARQARGETANVQEDLVHLHRLLDAQHLDPVAAMLLAQRIYARHNHGTSATATVRHALIDAAALTARYATGSAPYDEVVQAMNKTLTHLEPLLPADAAAIE